MQHWQPPRRWNTGRDPSYPPGWWIWPAMFISAFIWAGVFLFVF